MGSCLDFTTGAVAVAEESLERMPFGASQPETPRGGGAPDRVAEAGLEGGDDPRPRTTVEALTGSAIASYTYGCRRRCS